MTGPGALLAASADVFQDVPHDLRMPHERHFCLSFGVHASQTLHNQQSLCHSSSALRSAALFHQVLLSDDAPLELHHWDMSVVNTTSCTNEAAKKACTKRRQNRDPSLRPPTVSRSIIWPDGALEPKWLPTMTLQDIHPKKN